MTLPTFRKQFGGHPPYLVTRASGGQSKGWGGLLRPWAVPLGELYRRPNKKWEKRECDDVSRPFILFLVDDKELPQQAVGQPKEAAAETVSTSTLTAECWCHEIEDGGVESNDIPLAQLLILLPTLVAPRWQVYRHSNVCFALHLKPRCCPKPWAFQICHAEPTSQDMQIAGNECRLLCGELSVSIT